MARIRIPEGEGPEAARLFNLQPDIGMALAGVSGAIYQKTRLSMREREAVRMRVALINQCPICLGFRFPELVEQGVTEAFYDEVENWQASSEFSARERLAIEYTERFMQDHLNIGDDFFEQLHEHFSDEEIFDLSGTIAGLMANGRILQVLKIDQQCSINLQDLS